MRGETCPGSAKQGRQVEKNDLETGAVRTGLIVQRLPKTSSNVQNLHIATDYAQPVPGGLRPLTHLAKYNLAIST